MKQRNPVFTGLLALVFFGLTGLHPLWHYHAIPVHDSGQIHQYPTGHGAPSVDSGSFCLLHHTFSTGSIEESTIQIIPDAPDPTTHVGYGYRIASPHLFPPDRGPPSL